MNEMRPDKIIEFRDSEIASLKAQLKDEVEDHVQTAELLQSTQAERNVLQDQNDRLIHDFSKAIVLLAPFSFQFRNKMTDRVMSFDYFHRAYIFVLRHYPGGKKQYVEDAELIKKAIDGK